MALEPGSKYRDFTITKNQPIEELNARLIELVHNPTGASIMQIANDDEENVFCISFQTLPSSSNGVAHILEHTVLCGSKKFPVKDPFFSMTRRSLNTFMNAFTGSDFTCYPASSQVKKDYFNLLEVYLDAAFFPDIKKISFLQEGHRLEFSKPDDPKSPLLYKGVVFNEMKGAMTSPDSRFWDALMRELTPDLTYHYNSGGDPAHIPALTYDELVEFHANYYHPSRALFFFYGNIPLEENLDFIEEHVLSKTSPAPALSPIQPQKRFTAPRAVEEKYPASEGEKEMILGFGFLTAPITSQKTILAITLLDSILMETDASPLKAALLKSGLVKSIDSYIDSEMSEVPWIFVCKGCDPKNAEKIRALLFSEIEKIASSKLSKETIDAALHQLEFERTEISGGSYPYGLHLFLRSALLKQHGLDPENALMIHSLFKDLRNRTKDPEFIPSLLNEYLLNNPHFVELRLLPDEHLLKKEQEEENASLRKIEKKLGEKEAAMILDQTKKLAKYQEEVEKQSLECLPKIELQDIPQKIRDFPLQENGDVFFHDTFTNQILYADLMVELPEIPKEHLPYLSLFIFFLVEVGAGGRSYLKNLEYINAYIGGIEGFLSLNMQIEDPNKVRPVLGLKSKALYQNSEKLFAFLWDTVTSFDFTDRSRLIELLKKQHICLENALARNGMKYAYSLAMQGTREPMILSDLWYGFGYFTTVRKLAENFEKSADFLIPLFQDWQKLFLEKKELVVACDEEHFSKLSRDKFYGFHDLKTSPAKTFKLENLNPENSSAYLIPSPVAFTAMSMPALHYKHPDAPALLASSHIMRNVVLHKEIREKGGAYGSGARFSAVKGIFTFNSYRDPNLARTVEAFHKAKELVLKGDFEERDLLDAKLGIIQDLDAPISPGERALTAYSWKNVGLAKNEREAFRTHVLQLTKEAAAKATNHIDFEKGTLVSFAEKSFFERENPKLKKALPIKKL